MTDATKTIGLIGLGLIGMALARRLQAAGFMVIGYDVNPERRAQLTEIGGRAERPACVWSHRATVEE